MKINNDALNDLRFNIYMSGVGGQGIGVLSEVLLRAYDDAGYQVKAVDTHGLAQRGGKVESHLRVGYPSGNPLIEPGKADLAVSLERTEAYRALITYLRPGGTLLYYDTSWQSLGVRTAGDEEITGAQIRAEAEKRRIRVFPVLSDSLPDVRLQNISLLAAAAEDVLIGIGRENIEKALRILFSGELLALNLAILDS